MLLAWQIIPLSLLLRKAWRFFQESGNPAVAQDHNLVALTGPTPASKQESITLPFA